ncbi:MAG: T9SS C-terminal target domain-containing protein [Lewinella sp.]|nr:T9SS C-terminal target domain-containing protein [Lewinella sp.]
MLKSVAMQSARLLAVLLFFSFSSVVLAQSFSLSLEEVSWEALPGVQSFAEAQWNEQWLIVGGRLDGLHRRQPFASMASDGRNVNLWVVDPAGQQLWSRALTDLPTELQEQLAATNLSHYQDGDQLVLIGGYAYSATAGDHITFPRLTVIDLPGFITAVQEGGSLEEHVQSVADERMAVAGGQLGKIGDHFLLVGGHRFDGRYNPHGPDHGPGFSQTYTNAVRRFRIDEGESGILIADFSETVDEVNLHRRDYNLVPQILPDGSLGYTAFSGVFQHTVDLPFLNSVDFTADGYAVNNDFAQYLSHYHSAWAAMYSAADNQMHTIFFGGISQFYVNEADEVVEDTDVPFVRTISRVTRGASGLREEVKMEVDMPGLLGAGADFFPLPGLVEVSPGILDLDALPDDAPQLIGYLFGGIESTAPNVFWSNEDEPSVASARMLAVYLDKSSVTGSREARLEGDNPLRLRVFPNPTAGALQVGLQPFEAGSLTLFVQDSTGRIVRQFAHTATSAEEQLIDLDLESLPAGPYQLILSDGYYLRAAPFIRSGE